jgi:hypothetical protein
MSSNIVKYKFYIIIVRWLPFSFNKVFWTVACQDWVTLRGIVVMYSQCESIYGTISRSLEKYCFIEPSLVLACMRLAIVVMHIWVNSVAHNNCQTIQYVNATLNKTYELDSSWSFQDLLVSSFCTKRHNSSWMALIFPTGTRCSFHGTTSDKLHRTVQQYSNCDLSHCVI